jgi:8-oxo-dGTP pyrophosphatase MutT (NUDIX family)
VSVDRERVSVVCVFEGKILCFVGIDPSTGRRYYFLPGGKLEAGESELECARRETMEETGYRVRIEEHSRLTKAYPFRWDGRDYDCTTHFYRGHLDEVYHPPRAVHDQDYNKGPVWVPVSKLHALFDYSEEIHDAVEALVEDWM